VLSEREGAVEPGGKVLQRLAMNLGVVLSIFKGHIGSAYDSEFVEIQVHMYQRCENRFVN
jgi:hypothetical protein